MRPAPYPIPTNSCWLYCSIATLLWLHLAERPDLRVEGESSPWTNALPDPSQDSAGSTLLGKVLSGSLFGFKKSGGGSTSRQPFTSAEE